MSRGPITIEEKRKIQLEMLDEFDAFCQGNNLRYSLAYGTMLGAIRHKGFIPWDDDMDIMMPIDDIFTLKQLWHSNNIDVLDIDNYCNYEWYFPRLVHRNSYSSVGTWRKYRSYGIFIDLYPVVGLPKSKEACLRFKTTGQILLNRNYLYNKWFSRISHRVKLKTLPGYGRSVKKLCDFVYQCPYEGSTSYYSCAGNFFERSFFDFDLFWKCIPVPFESHFFQISAEHDKYLTQIYGNYMMLPPENERVPYHGGQYFIVNGAE